MHLFDVHFTPTQRNLGNINLRLLTHVFLH